MARNGESITAEGTMKKMKGSSFFFMIGLALLSFIGFGLMEYRHYDKIFDLFDKDGYIGLVLSIIVPIIMQGGRFSFLLATAVSMEKSHGVMYYLISGGITLAFSAFQSYEAYNMSLEVANATYSNVILYLSLFLIWVGLFIEIRLVMLLND